MQPVVVNIVKESFDIRIKDPAKPAPMEPLAQFQGSSLRAFAPSVAMTAGQKILLVYGRQNLGRRRLHQLVADHRNTERALFPAGFRNISTTHQLGLVPLLLQGCRQLARHSLPDLLQRLSSQLPSTPGAAFRFNCGKHQRRFVSFKRLYRFPNRCFGSSFALFAIPRSEVCICLSACRICICFLCGLHNTVIPFPM